ncbi:TPA: DNA-binding protein [Vibrio cholerae]|nr:DNA-binding protein [Enterobacter sp. CRENT-193]EGP1987845.1 helix-turn-helix domain-containing protein [Salmonella enterica subsp. enterica serovar Kentucky]EGR2519625.1 DNA-binding protein [Vibrio cholerae]EIH0499924.1 DNA-binding protein [Salmonella enterica]EKO3611841.1 DNA-binding protein [Vibrio metschnikovii]EKS6342527.1 DNA-binding protein [Enterobacter hormaechei]ELR5045226.1 DNA-binding protein [Providencia rettgeri]KAA6188337.1 helix-turn-helix domain-containing protein [Vibrio
MMLEKFMQQTLNEKDYSHLQMISVYEVTALLKISVPTLQRIRTNDPSFPKPYKISGDKTLRYRLDQLEVWLDSRRVSNEAI